MTRSSAASVVESVDALKQERSALRLRGLPLLYMTFQTLGIIYSDIGTSPLYVLNGIWPASGDVPPSEDVIGGISAIIWSLTLLPLLKYVFVALHYGTHEGEGGTFALFQGLYPPKEFEAAPTHDSLAANRRVYQSKRSWRAPESLRWVLLVWSLFGTSLTMADGILTASVSVTSAVGGIAVAKPSVSQDVIPISIAFLVVLFIIQPFGTARLAVAFAPVTCVWLLLIAGSGIANITNFPDFVRTGNYDTLAGVLLAVTGCEALFANLGQFNMLSIQISFGSFVYPALILAYLGQGARLITDGADVLPNLFYLTIPGESNGPLFWITYVFAILATLIASQTMITAVFSLVQQLVNTHKLPPFRLIHTSEKIQGQIYVPAANWTPGNTVGIATIVVVGAFKNLPNMTNAYGFAVSTVMFTTTVLIALQTVYVKQLSVIVAITFFLVFGFFDGLFWGASLKKVPAGAWVPLMIGLILLALMVFWSWAKGLEEQFDVTHRRTLDRFLISEKAGYPTEETSISEADQNSDRDATVYCVVPSLKVENEERRELGRLPLLAIFHRMGHERGVPHSFTGFIHQWPSLPRFAIFITVHVLPVGRVTLDDRYVVENVESLHGVYGVTYYLGFRESVDIDEVVKRISALEARTNPKGAPEIIRELNAVANQYTHIIPYYDFASKDVFSGRLGYVVSSVRRFFIEDIYRRLCVMFPETVNWKAKPDEFTEGNLPSPSIPLTVRVGPSISSGRYRGNDKHDNVGALFFLKFGALFPLVSAFMITSGMTKSSASSIVSSVDIRKQERIALTLRGLPLFAMAFQTLGIIYSDIGTSPLYVLNGIWPAAGSVPPEEDVVGAISAIVWYLLLYIMAHTKASRHSDHLGLYPPKAFETAPTRDSLTASQRIPPSEHGRKAPQKLRWSFLVWSLFGTSLTMADGILTASVSVTSAVGGIAVAKPDVSQDIIPISIGFLVTLFLAQPFGTARLASIFAPITCIWLLLLAGTGIANIMAFPGIWRAYDPSRAILYFVRTRNYDTLSGVLLAITGCEALFANLGQFNMLSIQLSFGTFVYPSLILAYLGQGARLIQDGPDVLPNLFYLTIPGKPNGPLFWILYVFGILATLIASQAMISATFSLVQQLVNMKVLPPFRLIYTSEKIQGQVYIPAVNWTLMVTTAIMVATFKDLAHMTDAYGFAVSTVMVTTTVLIALQTVYVKQLPVALALAFFLVFGFFDGLFWVASLRKVPEGAWVPLVIGLILYVSFYLGLSRAGPECPGARHSLALMVFWSWAKGLEENFDITSRRNIDRFLVLSEKSGALPCSGDSALIVSESCDNDRDATLYCVAPSTDLENQQKREIGRLPLLAVFHRMGHERGVPHSFTGFICQWPALPRFSVFITVHVLPVGHVTLDDRYVVEKVETLPGVYGVTYYLGFREYVDVEIDEIVKRISALEARLDTQGAAELIHDLHDVAAHHTHIIPYYDFVSRKVGRGRPGVFLSSVRRFFIEDVYRRLCIMFPETVNWLAKPDEWVPLFNVAISCSAINPSAPDL
ncbi:hypothetical protein NP233_g493 [Leucocoprinus birnbaumii]|uniref:Potassium transporter n=1 Tax=Leucocoprinus birnbaumii TaxID=56174 RepID=A0AAD5W3Y8_9AGAR|nr:hypothetical protein NP233_g493 [Leucocoprinus birnbaumii]